MSREARHTPRLVVVARSLATPAGRDTPPLQRNFRAVAGVGTSADLRFPVRMGLAGDTRRNGSQESLARIGAGGLRFPYI
jgi:hypothetical protein